jgi:tetratricopeptide (TPR) repeat protein
MRTTVNSFRTFYIVLILSLQLLAQSPSFDQAMQLFRQSHWAEAAAALSECEKADPGKTAALLYRGKALLNLGQLQDASAAIENYRRTHPRSDDAAYLLAYIRFRQNKPKESLQLFADAARLKDPTADDLKVVALNYVLLSDYDDAARYLEQSLAMAPENVEARYNLGRVRYQQNRFQFAIAAFEEVLRRDPNHVRAQDNLGLSLEAVNQIDAAIAAYRKAIAVDEQLSIHTEQPYLNLGILLAKSDRAEEAIPLLTRAVAIAPASGKAHFQLAKGCFALNRFEDARREAEKAVSADPNDSSSHYILGRIYQRIGKGDLAREQFRITEQLIQAKSASPGNGMASSISQH